MPVDPRSLALNKKYRLGQFAPQPSNRTVNRTVAGRKPFRSILDELAAGPVERSETEWSELLAPRVKPFTDAIDAATLNNRARSEYQFERSAAANQGLSSAFLGVLTGGKSGAEAEAYSKENFGGSYLGAQAMEAAAQNLRVLTNDWDDREWEISGEYLKAMQQVPAIREELRASIEKDDMDEYERQFKYATLLLDETYRQSQMAETKRQFNTEFGEKKRVNDVQLGMAAQELGIDSFEAATDRIEAGTKAKNAEIRSAELELKRAREQRQASKDKASIRQADARIRLAQEKLRLEKQKAKGGGSDAQKAERDLAIDILRERDTIIGKPDPEFPEEGPKGGMGYNEAYRYIRGLADAQMGSYRSGAYIDKWVKARLKAFGLFKAPPKKRQTGR